MRFSSRPKVSEAISLATMLFLVAAFSFYGFVGSTNTAFAASTTGATTSFKGTLGSAQRMGTVTPTALSGTTGKGTYKTMPMRGRPYSGTASPSIASRPNVSSTSVAAGNLLHNFDGVNAIQNGSTLGFDLEPPDEAVAAGNGYVANFVNLTGAIYRDNGQIVAGPFALAGKGVVGGFFGEDGFNNIVSDPRLYYDASSNTWFAEVLAEILTSKGVAVSSHVDLAVNTSGNPTTPWTIYRIDTTDANAAGCPCLPDYTILGVDQYNVYLLPNEFQNFGAMGFNGSQIYVIAKSQLMGGVAKPNVVHFSGLSVAGVIAYHIQAANEHTNASAEYFMNSLDPNNTFDNRIGVWAMTNRNHVAQGVVPTLSATVIHSEAYAAPANAQTPPGVCPCPGISTGPLPTTGVVQSDFDAMQEVQYLNGHLYGSLNTSVNIAGDTGARDGVAWFDVTPALSGGVISSKTTIAAQGYIASRGLYLMYPHIEHTFNGNSVIVFTFGGPGTYLSAGYAVMSSGAKNFGGIRLAAAGATSDNGFTGTKPFGGAGRWGDYSAGQLDPSGNGVWLATQYIPNNGDQFANWGNRVFEVAG